MISALKHMRPGHGIRRTGASGPPAGRRRLMVLLLGVAAAGTWVLLSGTLGGNIAPIRVVQDQYPVFTDVSVDVKENIVAMSDEVRFSLLTYGRTIVTDHVAEPRSVIRGPGTDSNFVCGIDLDPENREFFAVNNDTQADMVVFSYDANGDVPPSRVLHAASRGTWGVSVDRIHDEVAVTIEHINKVAVFKRAAKGDDAPIRVIQGPKTGLADPHGIAVDPVNDEIFVANLDSYHQVQHGEPDGSAFVGEQPSTPGGKFVLPAIRVFSRTANGDVEPLRVIQGPKTEISLPMKIHLDTVHNELAVANSGTEAILIFARTAGGDVAPLRRIQGPHTRLKKPSGVFIDSKNDEIWVANSSDHTATVYPRTADGDVAPLRIIRTAPDDVQVVGIGNPGGIAYDSIRQQILVPN